MERKKNIHAGHRQRLRSLFLKTGGFYMEDHQLLELLLFYSVPRRDTNPLAHQLLNHFGSLSGVIHASAESLMSIKGVGPNTVALLRLVGEIIARREQALQNPSENLDSCEKLEAYFRPLFLSSQRRVYVLSLNAVGKVLSASDLGSLGSTCPPLDLKAIVVEAARNQAAQIALAVPRPNALQLPTQPDLEEALRCERALAAISIRLMDVLFFSGEECVSLRRMHLLH